MKTFKQMCEAIEKSIAEEHPMIDVDGEMKHKHNSEGRPIHPTNEGIKNFHRWFGNSQAVDEHGRPQVMYRGLTQEHKDYQNKPITWVTPSKDYAGVYANKDGDGGNIMPVYTKIEKPMNLGFRTQLTHTKFKDISSRIKNNLMDDYKIGKTSINSALAAITHLDMGVAENKDNMKHIFQWQDQSKHLHDALKSAKYDSIESKEGDTQAIGDQPTHKTYGILHPENIKSAIGNNGSFSSGSNKLNENQ